MGCPQRAAALWVDAQPSQCCHWVVLGGTAAPEYPLSATITITEPLLIHYGPSVCLRVAISVLCGPVWRPSGHGGSSMAPQFMWWLCGNQGPQGINGGTYYIYNIYPQLGLGFILDSYIFSPYLQTPRTQYEPNNIYIKSQESASIQKGLLIYHYMYRRYNVIIIQLLRT